MSAVDRPAIKLLPQFETVRLLLRAFRPEDAEDVFAYAGDPDVTRFVRFETHISVAESRRYIEAALKTAAEHQLGPWAMQLKSSSRVIGACGFHHIALEDRRLEIGFVLARRAWHQGLAAEAVMPLLDYALRERQFNRVEAFCNVENSASEKVLLKCGFQFEGTVRQREFTKGVFCDLKQFGILRQDLLG
jgi:ribosomal-protein-alanine N-acetyltransferase